jgi:23S rRNA (guanosine2251-2'-O)-methyltransferase
MARRRHPPTGADPSRSPKPADRAAAGQRTSSQWIYGRHAVAAALGNPARRIRRAVALHENAEHLASLLEDARASSHPSQPEILERRALDALLPQGAVHQGVALETESLAAIDLEAVLAALPATPVPQIVLLLDQVTDPHNVGAILRSSAAFAAAAVIVPEHGTPPITGTLAKAASGALEAVPFLRVTNLSRCLDRLKEAGFWCVGLDSEAPQELGALDPPARIALVLGAEGPGLRRLVREHCDFLARIPARGELASLNVSNAAAIALYALTRPRA